MEMDAIVKNFISLLFAIFLVAHQTTFSQDDEFGTKAEALEILERTVNLVKSNKTVAFTMITAGGVGGLAFKDLYPFCWDLNGIQLAHPFIAGTDAKQFVSSDGKKIFEIISKNVKEGKISEISFMFGRPTKNGSLSTKEHPKTIFYTLVGNYICGSGYYPK